MLKVLPKLVCTSFSVREIPAELLFSTVKGLSKNWTRLESLCAKHVEPLLDLSRHQHPPPEELASLIEKTHVNTPGSSLT